MLIDGRKLAAELGAELTGRVAALGTAPGLAVVVATEDASAAAAPPPGVGAAEPNRSSQSSSGT